MSLQLQIETTSTCNAKCVFCPYPQAMRWGGLMSRRLYEKILDEASEIDAIGQVCITGLGEPTLDPMLVDRVRYARKAKPHAWIDLFTNGVHMTQERFLAIRDAGLTAMMFSLNASNAAQHERQMKLKGKYALVCHHIDFAIANRGNMKVEVRAVMDKEWTKADTRVFYDRWGHRDLGGHGQVIWEGNWAGENPNTRKFKPNEACGRALGQIYVLYDGKVTPCCFKPTGDVVFGDLSKQTIKEVYSDPEYVKFREAHFKDEADRYEFCKTCTRI